MIYCGLDQDAYVNVWVRLLAVKGLNFRYKL